MSMEDFDWDQDETYECDATVVAETAQALLIGTENGDQDWLPRSTISPYSDVNDQSSKGDTGEISIPLWKAEELDWV